MLLRRGSWSRKIEVAKASKEDEISVNLISSEYGNPWKYIGISQNTLKRYTFYYLDYTIGERAALILEF